MLISDLYTADFFKTGRYAPDFDAYIMQTFERSSQVVQATQFVPEGASLGSGKMGKVYELYTTNGGESSRRDFFTDVTPNVVKSDTEMVIMANYSEKVKQDKGFNRTLGLREYQNQLNLAIARLQDTFVKRLFNADKDAIETGTKKYEFNGWKKYFETNTSQVENTPLSVTDLATNYNAKLKASDFLNGINAKVDVNGYQADVIYTTRQGKVMLTSLEANRLAYQGEYKFVRNVVTYDGLPIVVVPEVAVPDTWKQKGEFVLFANQDPNFGARVLVPSNGGLIVSYEDTKSGFQIDTPIDMTFAPVQVHPKAGALCFLTRKTVTP